MEQLLTITRITSLALVNSVNPCQIAMLIMVLITILSTNPEKKRKILFTGLAFTFAVFLGYLFYGIILVQLFKTLGETFSRASFFLKSGFSILAMVVGALQIKDYFFYEPGGIATEMPMKFRPFARLFIKRITSPLAAFVVGFIIAIFLVPCTSAPYVVATESLSQLGFLGALPWLLYFNAIVVIPLIIITLIIYKGFSTVESVSGWKERNIRKLHLIAGILLFVAGLAMLLNWI